MNRRTTLATLFGQTKKNDVATMTTPPVIAATGLDPYEGPWGFEQASHLLRRTTFGSTYAQMKQAVTDGLDATIDKLFEELPLPEPPLNFDNPDDPEVPIGETWVDAIYTQGIAQAQRAARNQSFRGWVSNLILNEGVSLREKMVLFWHNHFVTANINDPKFRYHQYNLYRENPWGNFRQLVKEVTIAPSMLRYLNGNQNTAAAPNENFARELLELFTIGKGPLVADGDYTNYTEDDVVQMARVLTGWRDRGFTTINPDVSVSSYYTNNRHDQEAKQLSHRFDDLVITNMGDQEYAHLIDVIFEKEEVARFIARKLYRWFVYYIIDEDIEANVIQPMADIIINNDYEIQPALEALLKSEHFYDMWIFGPMIKSPIDFVMSTAKQLQLTLPDGSDLNQLYRVAIQFMRIPPNMEQDYLDPPSVAGWKAYYQEPTFYRQWISAATLPPRMEYTNLISGSGFNSAGFPVRFHPLSFIENFDDPFDPNNLIDELAKILFPQPITANQVIFLKEILIPGLPDFEWTVEYGDHLNNPNDQDLAMSVENKLRNLIQAMLTMPEFYLS